MTISKAHQSTPKILLTWLDVQDLRGLEMQSIPGEDSDSPVGPLEAVLGDPKWKWSGAVVFHACPSQVISSFTRRFATQFPATRVAFESPPKGPFEDHLYLYQMNGSYEKLKEGIQCETADPYCLLNAGPEELRRKWLDLQSFCLPVGRGEQLRFLRLARTSGTTQTQPVQFRVVEIGAHDLRDIRNGIKPEHKNDKKFEASRRKWVQVATPCGFNQDDFTFLETASPSLFYACKKARLVAPTTEPVLILGESGTGKELFARGIHNHSGLKGPFLAVNCGAMVASLIESELFGHVKGAFTGASTSKKGLFETAHNGTLLLDEIGDMPLNTQVKLLRVLEQQCVTPVGGTDTVDVNVRVLAATHRDVRLLVAEGHFRQDLYFRLAHSEIKLPSLSERLEDIDTLARLFIYQANRVCFGDSKHYYRDFTNDGIQALKKHKWMGNVRELKSAIERCIRDIDKHMIDSPDVVEVLNSMRWSDRGDVTESDLALDHHSVVELAASKLTTGHSLDDLIHGFEKALHEHLGMTAHLNGVERAKLLKISRDRERRIKNLHLERGVQSLFTSKNP